MNININIINNIIINNFNINFIILYYYYCYYNNHSHNHNMNNNNNRNLTPQFLGCSDYRLFVDSWDLVQFSSRT